jgi:chorismate mutase
MEKYESFIELLDINIIELLSLRQKYLLNSKNFKVFELGGYNIYDKLCSNLESKIYDLELKNSTTKLKKYEKKFNEDLFEKNDSILESLNLNRTIKHIYINFLYDICAYGDDEYKDEACDLDILILYKISERIHFSYEIIKYKYTNNKDFYNDLLETRDTSLIVYYLSNCIKQTDYLEKIKYISKKYEINEILICTFFRNFITPLSVDIQLDFLKNLKNLKNNKNNKVI